MKKILLGTILSVGLSSTLIANESNFTYGLGIKTTTLGLGLEYKHNISDDFDIKLAYNTFSADGEEKKSDIKYDYDLDLKSVSVLVDYYPFDNGFTLTTGLILNKNELSLSALNKGTIKINNTSYSSNEVGKVDGSVKWSNSIAPYIGIGYTSNAKRKGWSFSSEIGVMYQGGADISLDAKNVNPSILKNVQSDIKKEKEELKKDIDFDLYPVAGFTISYKF